MEPGGKSKVAAGAAATAPTASATSTRPASLLPPAASNGPVATAGAAAGRSPEQLKDMCEATRALLARSKVTHGYVAEHVEGFRLLAGNKKVDRVSKKQLSTVMATVGLHPTDAELGELLAVCGHDSQEELLFSEFLLLMSLEVDEASQEDMRRCFQLYDKNKTGYISKNTFVELLTTMGEKSSPQELEELLTLAECDDSDRVDYNAFVNTLVMRLHTL